MTIFDTIVGRDFEREIRLGAPLRDAAAIIRRQSHFTMLTGGRGFRIPKKEPAVHPTFGTTRGERKRAARSAANAKERARQRRECDRLGIPGAERMFGSL